MTAPDRKDVCWLLAGAVAVSLVGALVAPWAGIGVATFVIGALALPRGACRTDVAPAPTDPPAAAEELVPSARGEEVPQAHLEQLARLIAAYQARVEAALDDLTAAVQEQSSDAPVRPVRAGTPAHASTEGQPEDTPSSAAPPRAVAPEGSFYEERLRRVDLRTDEPTVRAEDLAGEATVNLFQTDRWEIPALVVPGEVPDLWVSFHGPRPADAPVPWFERTEALRSRGVNVVSLADPAASGTGIATAWYLGDETADLQPDLLRVVELVRSALGCRRVFLTGYSSGGFAALRAAAALPGSTPVVFAPQTDLARYRPRAVQKLLGAYFGGLAIEEAKERFPGRFSVIDHYAEHPEPWLYLQQDRGDTHHHRHHYTPMAAACGVDPAGGSSEDGRRTFRLVEDQEGHRPALTSAFHALVDEASQHSRAAARAPGEVSAASQQL